MLFWMLTLKPFHPSFKDRIILPFVNSLLLEIIILVFPMHIEDLLLSIFDEVFYLIIFESKTQIKKLQHVQISRLEVLVLNFDRQQNLIEPLKILSLQLAQLKDIVKMRSPNSS